MSKFSPLINNFNAGEWGPKSYSRIDLQKYPNSLRLCENWIPTIQGPLRKRVGSTYVASVETPAEKSRLIPYIIGRTAAFMLEFSSGVINIYNAAGTDVTPSISGVTPPWSESEIQDIQYAQTGDLLYIVHPSHPPHIFEFDGSSSADLSLASFEVGPLREENTVTTVTLTASAVSGTGITITASSATFASTDVDRLVGFRCVPKVLHTQWVTGASVGSGVYRWSESVETPGRINVYKSTGAGTTGANAPGHDSGTESDGSVSWQFVHSEYGFAKITAYSTSTSVTADVVGFPELPSDSTSGVFRFSLGVWSDTSGWPGSVGFYQQRIILGGTTLDPQRFDGSRINDFSDFLPGAVSDASAYSYVIQSNQYNKIQNIVGGEALFIGTQGGQFLVDGGSSSDTITPSNVRVRRYSGFPSDNKQALQVGSAILFLQAGRQIVRESLYEDLRASYTANDITVLAHHLGEKKLGHFAYQAEPDAVIWSYTDDGLLVGYTYEREQGVLGWHRHTLGGTDTAVESVAVIPDQNGVNDRLWIIVKRTINGGTKRYIELFDDDETNRWSDSCLVYDSTPATVISGLGHLEGEEVAINADGAVHPNKTVSSGSVTLNYAASTVVFGLPMTAKFRTQTIEGGSQTGVSQGKSKRIHNVSMRLVDTGVGLYVGPDANNLSQVLYRDTDDAMDSPVPEFTGDTRIVPIDSGYGDRGILYVEHNLPQRAVVGALWPQMEVYDAR